MPITYKHGDMFKTQADAIVNTVNCVGVMGKGVALEFKNRWPENFKEYKKLCDAKELRPGKVFIFDTGDMFNQPKPRYLINFPTKDHWRAKSKMPYIEDGLDDFVHQLKKLKIASVALPPLGCGNGGLPWSDVKAVIEAKLSCIDDIDFIVYAPKEETISPEHENIPSAMTNERAVLVKSIGEFEQYFGGHLTRISLQKITYFLQAMGISYGLEFAKNKNGPYSETLHKALKSMEAQHYISGYTQDAPAIQATPAAWAEADEFLSSKKGLNHEALIHRLSLLIEGYESPYGMELLASVHYLAEHESVTSSKQMIEAIQGWNAHKQSLFPPEAIIGAYNRLKEDNFIQ